MKPLRSIALTVFGGLALLLSAQEPPPQTPAGPVSPPVLPALPGPRLLDKIPDGTPPPPALPKPPFIVAPEHVRDTKTIQQGGRTITLQRIDPVDVPPPPAPAAPPTAEERAAVAQRLAAFRATHPRENFLQLGATVYLSQNRPPRTFVRLWPGGGAEPVGFWSNADFRLVAGLSRFADSTGQRHWIFLMWSTIAYDRTAALMAARGRVWQPPVFPVFPGEDASAAFDPAAVPGPASFVLTGETTATPAQLATIGELHQLYNNERVRLHTAYLGREQAHREREAYLKAHPPQPQDITVRYWLKTTAQEIPDPTPYLPQPAAPPSRPAAPPQPRRPRPRRRRTGFQPVMENGLPACFFTAPGLRHLASVLFLTLLALLPARAALDSNNNGVSDIWELDSNSGQLFTTFDPAADDDHDGWTNGAEAIAGTLHTNPTPPAGCFKPDFRIAPATYVSDGNGGETLDTPESFVLTFTGLPGKLYTVQHSPDLITWATLGNPILCNGTLIEAGQPLADGPKYFFRVNIADLDMDQDGLTNWEEYRKGTNPNAPDSDYDGIWDCAELLAGLDPNTNNNLTDPDGHLMTAEITTGLVAWWDFQTAPTQVTQLPLLNRFASRGATYNLDLSKGIAAPSCFAGTGMTSQGTDIGRADVRVLVAGSTLLGATRLVTNYWMQLRPDALAIPPGQANGPAVTLLAYCNDGAQLPSVEWQATRTASGGTRFALHYFSGITAVDIVTPGQWDSTIRLDDGRWHHLAINVGGTNSTRMFLDGTQVGSTVNRSISIPTSAATNNGYLYVGGTKRLIGQVPAPVSDLKGRIDSLMVHNYPLSATAVAAIYNRDRDSDLTPDRVEANTTVWRDQNANGLSNTTADAAETTYLSSPDYWQSPDDDMDDDGATTAQELAAGTDQGDPDSDNDLMPDGFEIAYGLLPNNPADALLDKEGDGLLNLDEYRYGANPLGFDTDHDTIDDLVEVGGLDGNPITDDGSDPTDATDHGTRRPADQLVSFNLGAGDRSGSHSEDYVLNVLRVDPDTGAEERIYTLRGGGFGQYTTTTRTFKKGETYTFQIQWLGTNNHVTITTGGTPTIEGPDWDYHLVVAPQGTDTGGVLLDAYDPAADTVASATPLCDPGDTTPASDDNDNVPDFLRTLQSQRVMFAAVQVDLAAPDAGDDGGGTAPPTPPLPQPSPELDLAVGRHLVPQDAKETTGGWLMLNFDDDAKRNNYAHGNTSAVPDYAFTGTINGENDLMLLCIRKLPDGAPAAKYRLDFTATHIRLWRNANRSGPIVSGQTELAIPADKAHLVVYAEGIQPHDTDAGTLVTSQFKIGTGAWQNGQKVKLRVAHPIVALYMEGRLWLPNDGKELADYATEITPKGSDGKPDPLYRRMFGEGGAANTFLVPGKSESGADVCFSVSGLAGQAAYHMAKLALKTPGTHIIFNGHANWGAGFAFGTFFTSFEEFFWAAGGGQAAFNIGGFHQHPALNPILEIGGFQYANFPVIATWNTMSDPAAQNRLIAGIPLADVQRFPNKETPVVAPSQTFQRHQQPFTSPDGTRTENLFFHYLADPNVDGEGNDDKRAILRRPGNSDVPPAADLKYKSLLLNQCNSFRNFIESFNHGRVIATWCFVGDPRITRNYVKDIVEAKSVLQMEADLENLEPTDPVKLPRGMFEITDFPAQ